MLVSWRSAPSRISSDFAKLVSEGRLAEGFPHLSWRTVISPRTFARRLNEMLDSLDAGRGRMRKLGAEVVLPRRGSAPSWRGAPRLGGADARCSELSGGRGRPRNGLDQDSARLITRGSSCELRSRTFATCQGLCIPGSPTIWDCRPRWKRWRHPTTVAHVNVKVNVDVSGLVIPAALVDSL